MIDVESLTMHYGNFAALSAVSFQAKKGGILGLLGPNGAGKTTVMRILTTYLYPTAGTAKVEGFDIRENPIEARRRIGYLPEIAPLYMDMLAGEYLRFVGEARGIQGKELKSRLDWLAQVLGIESVWKHGLCEISKGYRQRVGLAQALIHDPGVLILDEPTSGLDPLQIIGIRALIKSLAKNKTIIFSTHILPEVEALADRIVIIHEGRIVAEGTQQELARIVKEKGEAKEPLNLENIFISLLAPKKTRHPERSLRPFRGVDPEGEGSSGILRPQGGSE